LLNALNRTIYRNVRRMQSEKNLSFAILTYRNGHIAIAGQHEQALILRADGTLEAIDTLDLGFPIGLEPDIAPFVGSVELTFQPGDALVLFSDGITEAENVERELYGLARCQTKLLASRDCPARDIVKSVMDDLHVYIGSQSIFDDMTLVVLKRDR
ncbi:MAG: SpoIIE family protein phosphatase, partial [Cyanobacteria bacterium J06648_11]